MLQPCRNYVVSLAKISVTLLLSFYIAAMALAQTTPPEPNLLASPDGSRNLYDTYQNGGTQLWIENTRTHQRQMLLDTASMVSAKWNADGSAFYVELSNPEEILSYIYDSATLQRLDLRGRILAFDPGAQRFAEGHAYFQVDRWQDTKLAIINFHGHTDAPPPIVCFEFRYRVSRAGAVTKLSQRISPDISSTFC
jgi:hypothetical protein